MSESAIFFIPVEVWQDIARCIRSYDTSLYPSASNRSLARFSATCRYLRRAILPVLLEYIRLDYAHADSAEAISRRCNAEPELRDCVQHVLVKGWQDILRFPKSYGVVQHTEIVTFLSSCAAIHSLELNDVVVSGSIQDIVIRSRTLEKLLLCNCRYVGNFGGNSLSLKALEISSLVTNEREITDGLTSIVDAARLTSFRCSYFVLVNTFLTWNSRLPFQVTLESIDIHGIWSARFMEFIEALSLLHRLRRLGLQVHAGDISLLKNVIPASDFKLNFLQLESFKGDPEWLDPLQNSGNIRKLELIIPPRREYTADDLLQILDELPKKVEELTLDYCRRPEEGHTYQWMTDHRATLVNVSERPSGGKFED